MLNISGTILDEKLFKYGVPLGLLSFHSFLHIIQGMSYMKHEKLLIPNTVLLTETTIHLLHYVYTFTYFSRDYNTLSVVTGLNAISGFLGLTLINNYVSGTIHEHMSYLLTSVMGGLCTYMLFNKNKFLGYGYAVFSYAYLLTWLYLFKIDYEDFVRYNHFMELLLTSIFSMMTMMYVYIETNRGMTDIKVD